MKKELSFVLASILFLVAAASAKVGGGDILFTPPGAANVLYSHELHVAKGLKCSDCHYRLFNTNEARKSVTMADMGKGYSCGACHNGVRAFEVKANCSKCHL